MFPSRYSVSLCCSVYCLCVNVYWLLPPGVNPIAVNEYIMSYHILYHIINSSGSENELKCKDVKWFSFSDETVTTRFIWIIMSKCKSYCCYCIAFFYYIGTVSLCFSEYNVILPAWMNSVWIKLIPGHIRKRRSCCGWCNKDTQGSRVMAPCIRKHNSSLRWVVSLFVPGKKTMVPI
jgi:hypothetical protein